MKRPLLFLLCFLVLTIFPSLGDAKDLPKIAIWDLSPGDIKPVYAQDLTSILVSEISKLGTFEVYSQENVRTLAGWAAEKMMLGCTDTKCLTALGQMDIAKLISGRVGKIGNRYSVSLNLFDTQNAKAEKAVSEFGRSEDELIELVQVAVRRLLGAEVPPSKVELKGPEKTITGTVLSESGRPFKDPYTGMEFVFIKGGCFAMGDTSGDGKFDVSPFSFAKVDPKSIHEVCIDDFYLGVYEVTQGQWEKVIGDNPSAFKGGENYPVEEVSWVEVQQFLDQMNKETGGKYRLPTEAEWEYAARSGGKKEIFSGTNRVEELDQFAWYKGRGTSPVGQKKPNGLGLYDMSGNVWEWCFDWFDPRYYRNSPRDNPKGPSTGHVRVRRGGSWAEPYFHLRAAHRAGHNPSGRWNDIGFRVSFSAR